MKYSLFNYSMEQQKRTDKFKKRTLGGYYADFKRWDYRGKGSAEVRLMVDDLKNALTHQLVRIKKLKLVIQLQQQDFISDLKAKEKQNLALEKEMLIIGQKLKRQDNEIQRLNIEKEDLAVVIQAQDNEINRQALEIEKKEETLSEVRTQKKRGYTKVVKTQLSLEAKRLERLAERGVDQKMINNLEYTTRTFKFLTENNLTLEHLSLIIQAELLGNFKSSETIVKGYKSLNKLTELGYLRSSNGLAGASKYWFISLKGRELLKKYKNYLSYSKSILK